MTQLILLTVAVVTMAGLINLVLQAPSRDANFLRSVNADQLVLGRKISLAENAERIMPNDSLARVEAVMGGPPDIQKHRDWIFMRNVHSGYRVKFNTEQKVVSVEYWLV